MRPSILVLFTILGADCRREPPAADTGSSAGDGGAAGDTGGEADGGAADDTGGDGGAVDTGDTAAPPPDFVLAASDDETWADEGYVVETWTLSPDAAAPYASLFPEEVPTFFLMRPAPASTGDDEALDMLVWFHGGAIGDDSDAEDGGEMPYACQEERVKDNARRAVSDVFVPTALARRHRWVVVVPRNDWCDMWTGLGPDDPVDPERHYGYYHAARVLDFLVAGGAGFAPSGRIFGWGTSMGGTGAAIAASRYEGGGGFDALVLDSAPSSMFAYYAINHFGTDDEILEHVFGGPPYDDAGEPTDAWQRYADNSAETLITSGRLDAPLFLLWNSLDGLDDPEHSELLIEAMDATYPDTVRHGHHDLAHEAPGSYYHTQSTGSYPPWGYTGQAMIDFLDGQAIAWQEIEGVCDDEPDCAVGADLSAEDARSLREYSGGAARVATPDEGVGTAWCSDLPAEVAAMASAGSPLTITLVAVAKGTAELPAGAGLVTLRYEEGGAPVADASFRVSDFLPEATEDIDLALAQYAATRLEVTPGDAAAGRVCIDVHGNATVYLDALIFGVPAEASR